MKSIETDVRIVEKSIKTPDEWIIKTEKLLSKRLKRLRHINPLNINSKCK
jgi:hypothetical protein